MKKWLIYYENPMTISLIEALDIENIKDMIPKGIEAYIYFIATNAENKTNQELEKEAYDDLNEFLNNYTDGIPYIIKN